MKQSIITEMLGCAISWFIIKHNTFSDYCQFSDTDISQGSVATYARCGGILKDSFVANLLLSLAVKELWKSVNIWWSMMGKSLVSFLTHDVYICTLWVKISLSKCTKKLIRKISDSYELNFYVMMCAFSRQYKYSTFWHFICYSMVFVVTVSTCTMVHACFYH